MPTTTRPSPDATPAATLVVFRRAPAGGPPELLMVKRAMHMRFAPGMAVFPGGRIDPADHALAAQLIARDRAEGLGQDEVAARIAALRETLEETGLAVATSEPVTAEAARAARALLLAEGAMAAVLERFGWKLDLAGLTPFARWCPDFERAFDTRFYLTDLGTGAVELAVDGTENSGLYWSSAAETLAAAQAGDAPIIFPTQRNLERLALYRDFAEARAHAEAHPVTTITPWQEERSGVPHLVIPEGLGYPVTAEAINDVMRG